MTMTTAIDRRKAGVASRQTLIAKRCLDILVSSVGLVALAPLFACIALAIRLDSPGPVLFRQVRTGRDCRNFRIIKFRSMAISADHVGRSLTVAGDPRVTRVGAFLRASKLDELPQLFNVLFGQMSLVGPRPEVPDLFDYYTPEQQAEFFKLRPGVTDYASLLLRNESALLARAADPLVFYRQSIMPIKYSSCVHYLNEMSIWTDIWIIVQTLASLFSHKIPESLIDQRRLQPVSDYAGTTSSASWRRGKSRCGVAGRTCDGTD
jgi:lipopolysaccharide/colanic/teichoic acid biosynthesis glycosyltransferase